MTSFSAMVTGTHHLPFTPPPIALMTRTDQEVLGIRGQSFIFCRKEGGRRNQQDMGWMAARMPCRFGTSFCMYKSLTLPGPVSPS